MKKYVFVALALAAMVLLSMNEASARGPQGRAGRGPAQGGPAVRAHTGPAHGTPATGPQRVNPQTRPAVRQQQMQRVPAMGTRAGVPAGPTGAQVRQRLHQPTGPGNVATRRATRHGAWQQQHAAQVRRHVQNRYNHAFTPQWYANHPGAWRFRHPHPGLWGAVVAWPALANWVGVTATDTPYDYGMVYDETSYYVTDEGIPVEETVEATAVMEDTQTPTELAAEGYTGEALTEGDANNWLPLGIFTIAPPNSGSTPDRLFQFVVGKDGVLRGSYYDAVSGQAVPIQGAVNKQSQRAAWTIGSNRDTVMETNLGSFTEDQAYVRVHQGKGPAQQWVMVRIQDSNTGQATPSGKTDTNWSTPGTTNTNPNTPSKTNTNTNTNTSGSNNPN